MPGPASDQIELVPTPLTILDESRGVLDYSVADLADIDPDRRVTLARLAREMGALLGPLPGATATSDRTVAVRMEDLRRAEPVYVERGLYIPTDDPRYENGDQIIKTRFSRGVDTATNGGLKLPFRTSMSQPGVVFGADEYHLVARSPADLVRATKAKTQRANQGILTPEEAHQTRNRSAAHIMAEYIVKMASLEDEYAADHKLLSSLHRQANPASTPQNQYKASNLDKVRKAADELFHQTVETAAINNGWDQTTVNRVHRAIASNLYRRGSSREVNHSWRRYIRMQGLYINARRFKLIQSRMACESQHSLYQPYLETAKRPEEKVQTAEIDRKLIERTEAVMKARSKRTSRQRGSSRSR